MTRGVTPQATVLRQAFRLEAAPLRVFRVLRHLPRMHMCARVHVCDGTCRNGETHVTARVPAVMAA